MNRIQSECPKTATEQRNSIALLSKRRIGSLQLVYHVNAMHASAAADITASHARAGRVKVESNQDTFIQENHLI